MSVVKEKETCFFFIVDNFVFVNRDQEEYYKKYKTKTTITDSTSKIWCILNVMDI